MKKNIITQELYGGEVKIDFYPESHRYRLHGSSKWLVSVTAVTGLIDKSRVLIKWAVGEDIAYIKRFLDQRAGQTLTIEEIAPVLFEAERYHDQLKEKAASTGDQVHEFAEEFANAFVSGKKLPEPKDDMPEEVIQGINAFLQWFNENEVHYHVSESVVYSRELDIVGKADAVAKVNGEHVLLDYKTSSGVYPEHHYQAAAYMRLWNEEHKEMQLVGAKILHFNKKTGAFEVVPVEPLDQATAVFEALAPAKHALKRFETLQQL